MPAAGRGNDVVNGDGGNDSLFGGWGEDKVYGGEGNDRLHALAADKLPDLLDCGDGEDVALVRFSEKATTTLAGCEKVRYVRVLTADQNAGENGDTDAQAE